MASPKLAARSEESIPSTVYRLKIQLRGVKPAVWRRLEIPSDMKLPFVSRVLLMTMGWTDMHLHAFRVGRETFGPLDPDFPDDMLDERRYALEDILLREEDRLVFDYDFGDNWQHDVTVESIRPRDPALTYPRCLAGKRNCPPEDCGGPYGFAEFCKALADSAHPEHERMRAWGGCYDAATFDLADTNLGIASLFTRRKSLPGRTRTASQQGR